MYVLCFIKKNDKKNGCIKDFFFFTATLCIWPLPLSGRGWRWGSEAADCTGVGVWAESSVAHAEQRAAAGARSEGREHSFQSGHPLRQPHELPAAATRHQQEPPAPQHWLWRHGEHQQQLRHQQVCAAVCGHKNTWFDKIKYNTIKCYKK